MATVSLCKVNAINLPAMMGYKTASSHFCMIFTWSLFFRLFHHRHPIFFVVLLFFMSRQPSLALTVEDILLGVDLNPKQKRHGTFFPSELDLASNFRHQALEEADDNSTWDFHAPVESLVKRPRFTANAVMSPAEKIVRYFRTSTSMSAAQRIVYQYRAGLKINLDDESAISSSRSLPSTRSPTLLGFATKSLDGHAEVEKAPVDDRWRSPIGEPQLRHSESRAGALAEAVSDASGSLSLELIRLPGKRSSTRNQVWVCL